MIKKFAMAIAMALVALSMCYFTIHVLSPYTWWKQEWRNSDAFGKAHSMQLLSGKDTDVSGTAGIYYLLTAAGESTYKFIKCDGCTVLSRNEDLYRLRIETFPANISVWSDTKLKYVITIVQEVERNEDLS